jgi:excisionase family DNA binding protein
MVPEVSASCRLLRERDVAALIQLDGRTVRRLAADGALPRVRIGGSTRYRLADVQALIERGAEQAHPVVPHNDLELAANELEEKAARDGAHDTQ